MVNIMLQVDVKNDLCWRNGSLLPLFYTGLVKYLKCSLISVHLTLDHHIFTAQCKSDSKEMSLRLNPECHFVLVFSFHFDDHCCLYTLGLWKIEFSTEYLTKNNKWNYCSIVTCYLFQYLVYFLMITLRVNFLWVINCLSRLNIYYGSAEPSPCL